MKRVRMTAEGTIDYEALAQDAMRGVVRSVLERTAKSGLPGEHHFYVSFDTLAAGVVLSKRLREKYPGEMTIVLQHRFWDLIVNEDRFEVKLTFDGIPERLVIPFSSIKVFFDPSVRYGLQFENAEPIPADIGPMPASTSQSPPSISGLVAALPAASERTGGDSKEDETAASLTNGAEDTQSDAGDADVPDDEISEEIAAGGSAEIVSLDAFRKK